MAQLNEEKPHGNMLFYAFVGTLILGLLAAIGYLLFSVFTG
jgi:hypothetical protein